MLKRTEGAAASPLQLISVSAASVVSFQSEEHKLTNGNISLAHCRGQSQEGFSDESLNGNS